MNYFTLEGTTSSYIDAVLATIKTQFSIEALEVFGTESTIGYDYINLASDDFIINNINKLGLNIENISINRNIGSIIVNFTMNGSNMELEL